MSTTIKEVLVWIQETPVSKESNAQGGPMWGVFKKRNNPAGYCLATFADKNEAEVYRNAYSLLRATEDLVPVKTNTLSEKEILKSIEGKIIATVKRIDSCLEDDPFQIFFTDGSSLLVATSEWFRIELRAATPTDDSSSVKVPGA